MEYELAAAEFMFSLFFEQSPVALAEVMYMKLERGVDYTDMDINQAVSILERENVAIGATRTVQAILAASMELALANDDPNTAIECAADLYALTGNEEVKTTIKKLLDEHFENRE